MNDDIFGWLQDVTTYHQRQVERAEIGPGFIIDTARVSDGERPFETAVAHPRYNGGKWVIVEAYDTRDQSRVGHNQWVATMKAGLPDKLVDCANSAASGLIKMAGGPMEFPLI